MQFVIFKKRVYFRTLMLLHVYSNRFLMLSNHTGMVVPRAFHSCWKLLAFDQIQRGLTIYIYIYLYIHTHTHTHIYTYIYIYIGGEEGVYISELEANCLFTQKHELGWAPWEHVDMKSNTHTHIYIYIYIYILFALISMSVKQKLLFWFLVTSILFDSSPISSI